MITVTLSPKFQVVIPKPIRESLKLKKGTKLQVIKYGTIIEFIPMRPLKDMEGSLKGIDTDIIREQDREL
ncbi:AbrB/MazE/SpoVT family DNA-binding domain-containing protein [Candidatus Peregrinibacteria bacterium]|nr:AbrB/MazE/SpoVT family DNA-binding domain-containing protein [Candidatus Peregrinibacteria bacterium]